MDVVTSEKVCARCGGPILEGQAYMALAKDFKVGKENTYDLLTKSYKWKLYHDLTGPSRVKVVCDAK